LVNGYLDKYNKAYGVDKYLRAEGYEKLQHYAFPGNVRELKNLIKKAIVMCEERCLDAFIARSLRLGASVRPASDESAATSHSLPDRLEAVERDILENALKRCRTTRQMALSLNISQSTVVRKLRRHGLRIPA